MKKCCTCKVSKDESQFVKDKRTPDGLTGSCKECRYERTRNWVKNNPDKYRETQERFKPYRKIYYARPEIKLMYRKKYVERTFNIPYSLYEELETKQKGLCAICNKTETSERQKYLCVDHCHVSKKVRGLLCSNCNRALGLLKDDKTILESALNYLIKYYDLKQSFVKG